MPAPNPLSMLMGGGDGGSAATAPLEKERQALTGARHKYLLAVSDKAVEDAACATLRAALQSGALRRA